MNAGLGGPDRHETNRAGHIWTVFKVLLALTACSLIAVLMTASSEATETPSPQGGTPTAVPTLDIAGTPLPSVVPTSAVPQDAFVPDHPIYVKGSVIYMLHGSTEAPVPLASAAKQPSASPDGKHLVFITWGAQYQNFQNVIVLDVAHRTQRVLLNDAPTVPTNVETGRSADAPAWSDDDRSIYFSWSYPGSPSVPDPTDVGEKTDLTVTRCAVAGPCNTSVATPLTKPAPLAGGDDAPAPRPADPVHIVYVKYTYKTARDGSSRAMGQLQALNLSSCDPTPYAYCQETSLTNPLDDIADPVWTPNGRYLAFVTLADDWQSTSIWVMAFHPPGRMADYAGAHLLVAGTPFAADPVFSPDGKDIAFLRTASDGRLHLFIAPITFGRHPHIGTPREVKRADIVDGDRLAWIL